MKNFGPNLRQLFSVKHTLPDRKVVIFQMLICRNPDPDGTRYALYLNGVTRVLTGREFEKIKAAQEDIDASKVSAIPQKLYESLNIP